MYIRWIYTPNPTKENEEYVETIGGSVKILLSTFHIHANVMDGKYICLVE